MNPVGNVFLVGAGPGHPGLLTLRAVECLQRADLVIYDKLVSPELLDFANPHAERISVTEFGPCHAERGLPVQRKLIDAARQGRCVVRLKGGDPYLFGRGAEEAEALRAAGIPFEVVPGVTAALGVAAYTGIPLTHRDHASAVALVAGHETPVKGEPGLDWAALTRFPGTLVVYMGLSRLDAIAKTLMQNGKPGTTSAAVIQAGTLGQQRTISGRLDGIAVAAHAAGLSSPALLVVGPVTELRDRLSWFEKRPLFGKRVLLCRPRRQLGQSADHLQELGATVVALPTVEIGPPADWAPVDSALDRLSTFDWLVFTSVNGVRALMGRLLERGQDLRVLGHVRLAAIGPSTTAALSEFHLRADVVPVEYRSENLAAVLQPLVKGKQVLLARADRGRPVLHDQMAQVASVVEIAVYSQTDVAAGDQSALALLREGKIDFVVLTSSNIARGLARLVDERIGELLRTGQLPIVTISPVTSAAVKELGWPVAAEATQYTMAGVEDALLRLASEDRAMRPSPDRGPAHRQ